MSTLNGKVVRPLRGKILVRHYVRPEETEGGIIIPPALRENVTHNWWEFVDASPETLEQLRKQFAHFEGQYENIREGDILQTRVFAGIYAFKGDDGIDYYMLTIPEVVQIIQWQGA